MYGGGSDWAAQRMAEFLAVVTSYPDETTAESSGIERIAESVNAEVAAIVRDGAVTTCIGFPEGSTPTDALLRAAGSMFDVLEIDDVGTCRTTTVELDDGPGTCLVVGCFDDEAFSAPELNLLRGMARVLALGLRTLRSVRVERELREESQRQAAEIAERQKLFERLSLIERSISHRASLQEVFDAITAGAGELLGETDAIVGLRLIERNDPRYMKMVSYRGVEDEEVESTRSLVGLGAGGLAITEERLVIIEDYPSSDRAIDWFSPRVTAAMAAPVHEKGTIVGSLVFASRRPDRRFSDTEQDILLAFAQHASLALSDARSVHELKETFHESLSGISSKAAQEKKYLEEQLRHAQKMEAVGRLAGGIAHDFNNILMVIQTSAYLLQDSLADRTQDANDVGEILKASERAGRLVKQLLTFSRKEVTQAEVKDVNEMVIDMSAMLRRAIGSDISLDVDVSRESCPVLIDPGHLEQVMMNLAVNARDAMPGGGTLSIRTSTIAVDETDADPVLSAGHYVSLDVADTGSGIPRSVLDRIFDPFFTTKENGKGTGLGLATVYGIVSGIGGRIEVNSSPGDGTQFRILLPLCSDEAPIQTPAKQASDPQRPTSGSGSVLVVEDEQHVRDLLRRILDRNDYRVICASSGAEALELFQTSGSEIDLVLSDIVMPDMSGIEFVRTVRADGSECPVVLMSGYTDDRITDPSIVEDASGFLEKPFTEARLMEVLTAVTAGEHVAAAV